MREPVYNIFYYDDDGVIHDAAICTHIIDGSDEEKMAWLKSHVAHDHKNATRVRLPQPVRQAKLVAMHRLGRQLELFETLFERVGAPKNPLCCITPIVEGSVKVDFTTDQSSLHAREMQPFDSPGLDEVTDWLVAYHTPAGFDLPRLLNDDYFEGIRLLYNAGKYVSCMKLLVSCIDTISFLAFGDAPSVFTKWLTAYASLSKLGITPEELWEMRNSLLHMSNLDSRKVLKKNVRRVGFCVATSGTCLPPRGDVTYFNIYDLIQEVASGISSWTAYMNANPHEFISFIERYDRVISDDRITRIAKPQ